MNRLLLPPLPCRRLLDNLIFAEVAIPSVWCWPFDVRTAEMELKGRLALWEGQKNRTEHTHSYGHSPSLSQAII